MIAASDAASQYSDRVANAIQELMFSSAEIASRGHSSRRGHSRSPRTSAMHSRNAAPANPVRTRKVNAGQAWMANFSTGQFSPQLNAVISSIT